MSRWQAHSGTQNRLRWSLDCTFREDRCQEPDLLTRQRTATARRVGARGGLRTGLQRESLTNLRLLLATIKWLPVPSNYRAGLVRRGSAMPPGTNGLDAHLKWAAYSVSPASLRCNPGNSYPGIADKLAGKTVVYRRIKTETGPIRGPGY